MRIARALALAGVNSRRKSEEYIRQGLVSVNGEVIRDLGRQVDFDQDEILFRGKPVHFEKYVYFVLNKPVGYTTTASDPHAKKTVFELLPQKLVPRAQVHTTSRTRVFPVGRLDRDSSGLLLFTNDGELANCLIHPRYGVGKWYEVRLDRTLEPRDVHKLLEGVQLKEGKAKVEKIHKISKRVLRLLIREGKKREVRRIFAAISYEVVELCRIAFGPLMLGKLPPAHGRFLAPSEIDQLKKIAYPSAL